LPSPEDIGGREAASRALRPFILPFFHFFLTKASAHVILSGARRRARVAKDLLFFVSRGSFLSLMTSLKSRSSAPAGAQEVLAPRPPRAPSTKAINSRSFAVRAFRVLRSA